MADFGPQTLFNRVTPACRHQGIATTSRKVPWQRQWLQPFGDTETPSYWDRLLFLSCSGVPGRGKQMNVFVRGDEGGR